MLRRNKIHSERFAKYSKMAGKILSGQFVAQGLSALSGLFLVRTLSDISKKEYALFIIANSMQVIITSFAETGSSALTSKGGKLWNNPIKMGQLLITYQYVRYHLAFFFGVFIMSLLAFQFYKNGANWVSIVLAIIILTIELILYMDIGNYSYLNLINSRIKVVQISQLISPALRLMFLAIAYFFHIDVIIALGCSLLSTIFNFIYLKSKIKDLIDINAKVDQILKTEIINIVKMQIWITIFIIFQGNVVIFMASFFSSVSIVANLGAISRISIIFSIFNSVFAFILYPSFSKINNLKLLKRRYVQISILYVFICIFMVIGTFLFSDFFLFFLGRNYKDLKYELIGSIIATAVYNLATVFYSLNTYKGWIKGSWITIPFTLITQMGLLMILNISKLQDLILFQICSSIPPLIINLYISYRGFKTYSPPVLDEV